MKDDYKQISELLWTFRKIELTQDRIIANLESFVAQREFQSNRDQWTVSMGGDEEH